MPKQSTRHKYRTRREKNKETKRIARILLIGAAVFVLLMLLRNGRDIYNYLRTSVF